MNKIYVEILYIKIIRKLFDKILLYINYIYMCIYP